MKEQLNMCEYDFQRYGSNTISLDKIGPSQLTFHDPDQTTTIMNGT
jgi:hypothetical protein